MQTQEYIDQETKARESSALPGTPRLDETTCLSKVPRAPSVPVIDFYRASDRVLSKSQDCSKELEIDRKTSRDFARRLPSVQRVDRLEDSLYWLFSGATIVYLLSEIIGH
jgi:hypothetical protein